MKIVFDNKADYENAWRIFRKIKNSEISTGGHEKGYYISLDGSKPSDLSIIDMLKMALETATVEP